MLRIAWIGLGQFGFLQSIFQERTEKQSRYGIKKREREREELFRLKEEQMSDSFKNKNNQFPAVVILK